MPATSRSIAAPALAIAVLALTMTPSRIESQAPAIVRVRRQPFVGMLDDHQLAVTDEAGARIHDHAIGSSDHRLARAAADVDALLRLITGDIATHDVAVGGPAPVRTAGDGNADIAW